jgi:hypothetical protein
MDWLYSEHMTCVFYTWSVPRNYLEDIGVTTQFRELDSRVEVSHWKFKVEELEVG